jgi:hypothetical protein
MRWWDGAHWTENFHNPAVYAPSAPVYVSNAGASGNGMATASLVLGIIGFVLMAIPLFIGLFLGGIPDLLAVICGIAGLNNAAAQRGVGKPMAVVGLVLGGVSILSAFLGAGTLW